MGCVVKSTPRLLYPREREPVPTVQGAGWAPGPVWTGAENLAPAKIRCPDRPAQYPGPHKTIPFKIRNNYIFEQIEGLLWHRTSVVGSET